MKINAALRALVWSTIVLAFPSVLGAAPADLDPTFGGSGKVTTPVGTGSETAFAVAMQSDGKIVTAGVTSTGDPTRPNYDFALVRYNADGTLDTTFNSTGKVTTPIGTGTEQAYAVALQSAGKIVAAGYSLTGSTNDFAVVRYNTNGSLDTSFNGTGKVTTKFGTGHAQGHSVAVQPDGKIVVAGESGSGDSMDFAVVRYNGDGSLDTSFYGTGKVTTGIGSGYDAARSVAVQSDGKIVLSGSTRSDNPYNAFAIVRYDANGRLDTSFSGDGKVITNVGGANSNAYDVVVQTDGKILVSGRTEFNGGQMALVRYNPDGTPDEGFGSNGIVIGTSSDWPGGIAVQADGKIAVASNTSNGSVSHCAMVRYLANGSLDTTFNGTGKVITPVGSADSATAIAIQSDGKIVLAGNAIISGNQDFAVVRYQGDLTPFGAWKLQHLGNSSAPDNGDPDGDGVLTLAEYGLGLPPEASDPGLAVSFFDYAEGRRLRLFVQRDPEHNDISVQVLAASTVAGPWSAIGTSTRGAPFSGPGYVAGDGATAGVKTVEVRDTVNAADAAMRFLRVRVSVGSAPASPD